MPSSRPLVALTAALLLSGCGLLPTREVVTTVIPPAHLLAECPETAYTIVTNGDLARAYLDTRAERSECAGQIRELRAWAAENAPSP